MLVIPDFARPVLSSFEPVFYHPTYQRFLVLLVAAVLTTGRRTVANLLRTAGALAPGHPSSYHRVLSRRRWSSPALARILIGFILDHWAPDGPVSLAGDDTVDEHRGARVFGKGCHRDPVRSTHSYTAYRWGHKWVVLTILVQFPFAATSARAAAAARRPARSLALALVRSLAARRRGLAAGPFAFGAFSGLRYSAASTGKAQGRWAKGNGTRMVRTTHLCPQR